MSYEGKGSTGGVLQVWGGTGWTEEYVSNIVGPTGPQGSTGPTGPQGPTGPIAVFKLRQHDTSHSPIALWQLDGDLIDSVGGKTLTSSGNAAFSEVGPPLRGYAFEGTNFLQRNTTDSNLGFTGAFSVLAIMNMPDSIPTNMSGVFFDYSGLGSPDSQGYNALYSIAVLTPNRYNNYFAEYDAGSNVNYTASGYTVPAGQPFHYAFTRSPDGTEINFYINGKPYGSAVATPPNGGQSGVFRIGATANPATSKMNRGSVISSVKVVPTTLSAAIIQSEYNKTFGYEIGVTGPQGPTGPGFNDANLVSSQDNAPTFGYTSIQGAVNQIKAVLNPGITGPTGVTGYQVHTIAKTYHVVGVAGLESSQSTGYVPVGAIRLDPRDYRPTVPSAAQHVKFSAVIEASAGLTGSVALQDLTTGTFVANSVLGTTSPTPVFLRSQDLSFPQEERSYEVQVQLGSSATGPTGSNAVTLKLARIEISHD